MKAVIAILVVCILAQATALQVPKKNVTSSPKNVTLPPKNATKKANTTLPTKVVPLPPVKHKPWPIDPVTKLRYPGAKEFVIVLHDNLVGEVKENMLWFNKTMDKFQHKLKKLQAMRTDQIKRRKPYDDRIAYNKAEIVKVMKSVSEMRAELKERTENYEKAQHAINVTDWNWNRTISSLTRQQATSKQAIKDVDKMYPLLKKRNPQDSIMKELLKAQKSATSKTSSLLETALADTKLKSGRVELRRMLDLLRKHLVSHSRDIAEDLIMATKSRQQHLSGLIKKLAPFRAQIRELNHMITISLRTVPDYKNDIDMMKVQKTDVERLIQLYENEIIKTLTRIRHAKAEFKLEMAEAKNRTAAVEKVHQWVKTRLVNGNKVAKTSLKAITNILQLRSPHVTQWNNLYPPRLSVPASIDPQSALPNLCAAFNFDEKTGNHYVVDSGPMGFDGKIHGHDLNRIKGGHNKRGSYLEFNGMESYVDIGKLGNFGSSLRQFSVEMWVRTIDTHTALASLVKVIDNGLGQVLAIEPNRRVGRIENGVWPTGQQKSTNLDLQSGTTLCYLRDRKGKVLAGHVNVNYFDGKWHKLRWTVADSKLNQMAFYVDDKLVPWVATIEQMPSDFAPLTRNIFIGAGNSRGTPEGYYDGAIDDVKFFCGKSTPVPNKCCKICNGTTKACGDMCIRGDRQCFVVQGCACNPKAPAAAPVAPAKPVAAPVKPPVKPAPAPGWIRGNTTLNEKSLFPHEVVPTKAAAGPVKQPTLTLPSGTSVTKTAPKPKDTHKTVMQTLK